MSTIWQRAHLNVNDPTAFPKEYIAPCIEEGYACVQVMLNPKHPDTSLDQVSYEYLNDIREMGAKAFGFVWADDFQSPEALFDFVRGWRAQSLSNNCALTGFVINCEDGWEAHDQATAGGWSKVFLALFRSDPLTAKVSLAINSYLGGGGIALDEWAKRSARFYAQTFHEGVTHEWPIDGYVSWCKFYGYKKVPAMLKANLGTYKPYPSRAEQIAAMAYAKVIGYSAWYAEGGGDPHDVLIPLLREARAAGVCA